jgi:hypothetical protein
MNRNALMSLEEKAVAVLAATAAALRRHVEHAGGGASDANTLELAGAVIAEAGARYGAGYGSPDFPGLTLEHIHATPDAGRSVRLESAVLAALAYEAEAFDGDEPVNGADLVDWFADWRADAKAALEGAPAPAETGGTVRLVPTWRGVLPALLAVLQDGSDKGRELARLELARMARAADMHNAANAGAPADYSDAPARGA